MTDAVGPGNYTNINFEVGMKGFTSKKMLGKCEVVDRRLDPNEPGPGKYEIPSSFEFSKRDKPPDPHISRKKQENEFKIPGPGEYNLKDTFEDKSRNPSET